MRSIIKATSPALAQESTSVLLIEHTNILDSLKLAEKNSLLNVGNRIYSPEHAIKTVPRGRRVRFSDENTWYYYFCVHQDVCFIAKSIFSSLDHPFQPCSSTRTLQAKDEWVDLSLRPLRTKRTITSSICIHRDILHLNMMYTD